METHVFSLYSHKPYPDSYTPQYNKNMTQITTIPIKLKNHNYKIKIGPNLLPTIGQELQQLTKQKKIAILCDQTIANLHLNTLTQSLKQSGFQPICLIAPAGEQTKSFPILKWVLHTLLDQRVERGDLLIAFGGGVIGDLTGFAAAILHRGIKFIQIPTTLLAQVDSAIGGKTGINTKQGKNLIGAFHQPSLVISDINLLNTLPLREKKAGYAEIVKYALLGDKQFFLWLEKHATQLLSTTNVAKSQPEQIAAITYAITHSCQIKAQFVQEDEQDQNQRALLNLGHSFGHALESLAGYSQTLLHGEAIAIGMSLAFQLCAELRLCPQTDKDKVLAHLHHIGLPTKLAGLPKTITAEAITKRMLHDKKNTQGQINLILVRAIGQAFLSNQVTYEQILAFLESQFDLL